MAEGLENRCRVEKVLSGRQFTTDFSRAHPDSRRAASVPPGTPLNKIEASDD